MSFPVLVAFLPKVPRLCLTYIILNIPAYWNPGKHVSYIALSLSGTASEIHFCLHLTRFLDSPSEFSKAKWSKLLNSPSVVIHLNIKTGIDRSPGRAIFLNLRDLGGKSKHDSGIKASKGLFTASSYVSPIKGAGSVSEISVTGIKHDFPIWTAWTLQPGNRDETF